MLSAPQKKSGENTTDSNSMGLRLSYSKAKGGVNYNLSFSESKEDRNNRKSSAIRQGLNGRYIVVPRYFSLSASATSTFSESSNATSEDTEAENLSYNFSASSSPLPTIRGSFSYNHNEHNRDGTKLSKNDSFGLSVSMDIYRGVSLRLSSYVSEYQNLVAKRSSESESVAANLSLKPWKTVSINLNSTATKSTSKDPRGTSSLTSDSFGGNFNIRLTRNLYYSNIFSIEPSQSERHSIGWRLTRVLNATATYDTTDSNESKSLTIGWRPIPKAGLSFGFSESEQLSSGNTFESMFFRGHIMFL